MPGKLPPIEHRDVGPFLQMFRTFLRGRENTLSSRFADEITCKDQPPPNIPGGPYHRTTKIYYHTRDRRRLVEPPIEISSLQITDGKNEKKSAEPMPGIINFQEFYEK